ncbi:MAG: hypothetical protein JXB30_10890 [Anaerolineae bacterium]|nr:hypothetical protein [Anaerolineae bacterium]
MKHITWYVVVGMTILLLSGCTYQMMVDMTPVVDFQYPTDAVNLNETAAPTGFATPTAAFGGLVGMGGYPFITLEDVGDIPAGSRVRAWGTSFDGINTIYYVVAQDEETFAEACEYQLSLAPDVTPGPTPIALFDDYIGMGYLLITTEQVGNIAAGTRVRISHGIPQYNGWLYAIVAQDEVSTAEAREDQLALAPDVTPGPSPTVDSTHFAVTPTFAYADYVGIGGYPLLTIEDVGDIPAGSRVRTYGIYFNGVHTIYEIMAQDEVTTAEAREDQLMWAPDVTPGSTPIDPFYDYIGRGYLLITTEQVGDIPAGARVRITYGIPQYNGCLYGIMAEDEVTTAEAREYQLTLAPGVTPGPTPTAMFDGYTGEGYPLITTEQVGDIPAGTRVRIISWYVNHAGYTYIIVAEDGVTTAEAREHQLALAPPSTSEGAPNLTLTLTPTSKVQ